MGFSTGPYQNIANNRLVGAHQDNLQSSYRDWLEDRLRVHEVEEPELRDFQKRFSASQFFSIDAFIAANPFYKVLGSLMVAAILLKCEQEQRLNGDWYQLLFNELVAKGPDFPPNALSVVTFNYDRSLEMFLFSAFVNAFGLKPMAAWSMVELIKIVHVYGDLGKLPPSGDTEAVPYGRTGAIRQASERIQLMSPRAEDEKTTAIRSLTNGASKVVFLGFGFDSMNLDVVGVKPTSVPTYASCFNLSIPAMRRVEDRIRRQSAAIGAYVYEPVLRWGERGHMVGDFLHNSEALA